MSSPHFIQGCPTCGRSLLVRVEYLGKQVSCLHCRARFVACDPSSSQASLSDSGLDLLRRAEELLERAQRSPLLPPATPRGPSDPYWQDRP